MKHTVKKIKTEDNIGLSVQLTVTENTSALLDGCREIKEYEGEKITFNTGKLNISFCGNNLIIKNYGDGLAEIQGEFSEISFG